MTVYSGRNVSRGTYVSGPVGITLSALVDGINSDSIVASMHL